MHLIYHHRTRGREVEGVHIRGVAGGLAALGHTVSILGPPGVTVGEGEETGGGLARRSWKGRLWEQFARGCPGALFELAEAAYSLVGAARLIRACRRERPAAIYERYAFFNAAGLLAARACRLPLLLEVNDTVAVERQRRGHGLLLKGLASRLESRVFRGAAACFPVSGYLRDLVAARGVPAERIHVTPNAIDPARFDPGRTDGAAVRRRLGLEDRVVIGFVGRFATWHGMDLLAAVIPPVLEKHPKAAFLLVGDGRERPMVEQAVAAAGQANRVRFTGELPHAEVPDYLAAMDVGLMPHSNRFGSPVKIFEYMSMGVVPVGPRLGPLEEAVEDGVTGLLFPPQDAAALQAALEALIADPDRRARLGAAARARVLSRHLWRHNAEIIVAALPDGKVFRYSGIQVLRQSPGTPDRAAPEHPNT
jgi:glycosyltransferase involved in cell wall biosynthesis